MHTRIPCLFLLLGAACAGGSGPQPVTPEELSRLDAGVVDSAQDAGALTRIGIRYYEAERYERSRDVLQAALTLEPAFTTAAYLGLANERLERFDDAEAAYRGAASLATTDNQRQELDRRLVSLSRSRMQADARRAIARERELSAQPPVPRSVAVLPWSYVGDDAELAPLARGVPHLVMSDLGNVSSLTLIERERVRAILDEIALSQSGYVDPATAVRSGRLLQAEWVVAGVVRGDGNGVRLEAQVFRTSDAAVQASAGADDQLEQLFALERGIVVDLVEQLGVPVSPGERRTLSERPAADLQAFLAFSEGLVAQERGDYTAASGSFALALARDPSFGAARALGERNALFLAASRSTPDALTSLAASGAITSRTVRRGDALYTALQTIAPSAAGIVEQKTNLPVSNPRLAEALGQDNPARIAIIGEIIIIIPRP